jgi:hypothetical protein
VPRERVIEIRVIEPRLDGTIIAWMADRAALERDLEEIGTRLAWVRDYL